MNPNTDFETVTARGDHGGITFRKSDGVVVGRDFDSGYENDPDAGYPRILWANPDTLEEHNPTDILRIGYYYKDKNGLISYEPPIEPEELTADPLPTPEKPMKPFDLEKAKAGHPVVTRDGRRARIICLDRLHERYTIVALVQQLDGTEDEKTYAADGRYCYGESSFDLFLAPDKKECWVNFNKTPDKPFGFGIGGKYATKEDADDMASPNRVACVHIEWEE